MSKRRKTQNEERLSSMVVVALVFIAGVIGVTMIETVVSPLPFSGQATILALIFALIILIQSYRNA